MLGAFGNYTGGGGRCATPGAYTAETPGAYPLFNPGTKPACMPGAKLGALIVGVVTIVATGYSAHTATYSASVVDSYGVYD